MLYTAICTYSATTTLVLDNLYEWRVREIRAVAAKQIAAGDMTSFKVICQPCPHIRLATRERWAREADNLY